MYITLMEFKLNKEKAVEALVYITSQYPGADRFHIAKILYFAERSHIHNYGRPIVGDIYIAMDNGPVPSFAYDILKGTCAPDDKSLVVGALEYVPGKRYPAYEAGREAKLEYFSQSDIECLDWAIAHCRGRTFGSISDETHAHKAWSEAEQNASMKWEHILDGADDQAVSDAEVFASYGIL